MRRAWLNRPPHFILTLLTLILGSALFLVSCQKNQEKTKPSQWSQVQSQLEIKLTTLIEIVRNDLRENESNDYQQVARQVSFINSFSKKLFSKEEEELANLLQALCPIKFSHHLDCVGWAAHNLANTQVSFSEQQELKLLFGPGRGKHIARWLQSQQPGLLVANQIIGRELFLENQIDEARDILTQIIAKNKQSGFAYYWLGQLETQAGNWEEAEHWVMQFQAIGEKELKAGNILQYQIEKAEEEESINENLSVLYSQYFTLHSEAKFENPSDFLKKTDELWLNISSQYGFTLDSPIEILVYEGNKYSGRSANIPWVAAIYDGKLRVPLQSLKTQKPEALLKHELIHALLDKSIGPSVPIWFHEGFAQYYEEKRVKSGHFTQKPPSFDEMREKFASQSDPTKVRDMYLLSLKMFELIINEKGEENFKNMLSTAMDEHDFESAWLQYYNGEEWEVSSLYSRSLKALSSTHKP